MIYSLPPNLQQRIGPKCNRNGSLPSYDFTGTNLSQGFDLPAPLVPVPKLSVHFEMGGMPRTMSQGPGHRFTLRVPCSVVARCVVYHNAGLNVVASRAETYAELWKQAQAELGVHEVEWQT